MCVFAWTILAIATILAAPPSQAQIYDPNYPVCMKSYSIGGGSTDCSYTSLAQCNATASGRAAQCSINPYFRQADERPGPAWRRNRRLQE